MAASQVYNSSDTPSLDRSTGHGVEDLIWSDTSTGNMTVEVSTSAQYLRDVTAMLWYVMPPVLLLLGTLGNVMIVLVMRGMRASQSTACLSLYFTALAVSDQCQLLTNVVFNLINRSFSWPPSFFKFDILCFFPKFVWNAASFTSAWFLVAMTFQRVTAVLAPHRVGVLCTVRRGRIIVTTLVILGCAVHLQFLFTWVYEPEVKRCKYRKMSRYFMDAFEWIDLVCYSALPFILLAAGNSVLIWKVSKSMKLSRKMRSGFDQQTKPDSDKLQSMTVTVALTSVAFLVLTLPICIHSVALPMIYSNLSDDYFDAMIGLVKAVTVFMWMSACATNFYLYLLSGSKFREETKRYFCSLETQTSKTNNVIASSSRQ